MAARGSTAGGRLRAVWLLALAVTAMPAAAQVTSQGRASIVFMVGQGSGPTGGIAADIVAASGLVPGAQPAPDSRVRATSFRFGGGYQFADHMAAELALTHIGTLRSRAPYTATATGRDTLVAETEFDAIEADLAGRITVSSDFRVDLSAGIAITGLKTTLRTELGSALPPEPGTLNARRTGLAAGIDAEWRLGNSASLIAGYHLFSHVGSSQIVGLASGNMTLIAGGVRIEF